MVCERQIRTVPEILLYSLYRKYIIIIMACHHELILFQIHIILGIGHFRNKLDSCEKGVMADVAAASSDPIFINHHAMVDCILEKWLQRNPNAQYPQNNRIRQGHKADDYTVPFFPLVTHREMFKTADNFGYTCDDLEVEVNVPNSPSPPNNRPGGSTAFIPRPAMWLFLCVVLGVGILVI